MTGPVLLHDQAKFSPCPRSCRLSAWARVPKLAITSAYADALNNLKVILTETQAENRKKLTCSFSSSDKTKSGDPCCAR